MNHRHTTSLSFLFLAGTLVGLASLGCSSETSASPGSSGSSGNPASGGASAAQIGQCKESCDKMKFFGCNSAEEQARCYADCEAASASQIELFNGCAGNSICDPACRTSIEAKAPDGTGGGGATASSCASACDKLVSCSFIPVSAKAACNSACATEGYQYQIDCVNQTACESIESACGGSTDIDVGGGSSSGQGSIADCESECDSINFFKCAPVSSHAACRDRCASATSTARDSFSSCSGSSGVDCERKKECLDAFLD
jgi:hypothetical protein